MRTKVWGFVAVAAALLVGSVMVTPVNASAATPPDAEQTFSSAPPLSSSSMSLSCTPAGSLDEPLKVNVRMTCTAYMTSSDGVTPTGSVDFHSDDDTLLPPSSCTLHEGLCDLELLPGTGSAGMRTISFSYAGDATHSGVSVVRDWKVARRASAATISCPPKAGVGEPATCTVTVSDNDQDGPAATPTGVVALEADVPGTSPADCRLDGYGTCRVSLKFAHRTDAPANVFATFHSDGDHFDSTSPAVQVTIVKAATKLEAQPAIASLVSPITVSLRLSARLTDKVTGRPVAGATIRFKSDVNPLCSAVTDVTGTATCSGPLPVAGAALGYDAFYDGDRDHLASTASAAGVRL
jgi:hypothetical protein